MRALRFIFLLLIIGCTNVSIGQEVSPKISEMKWGRDFKLHIKLSNDTNHVMDIRALPRAVEFEEDEAKGSATYYPVNLDDDFIDYIKSQSLSRDQRVISDSTVATPAKTLWSALNQSVGGGYVHFVNTLIYSLESQQLNLYDAIMERPVTTWKPKPKTKTWKRTHKWQHHFPSDQKLAHVEYKKRRKEKDLQDLHGVPERFVQLFLNTSQKEYDDLQVKGQKVQLAQIDLVRLLLGAKYLGADQIDFIRSNVVSSVLRYNVNHLPSIIVFDNYNAAVAMTLDRTGYKIDHVVFSDQHNLSNQEFETRLSKIEAMIVTINNANEEVFKRKLSTYYGP